MTHPLSLYKTCLFFCLKNDVQECEILPRVIIDDLNHLKLLFQKWKMRIVYYNLYFMALCNITNVTWETLTCPYCGHGQPWPDFALSCDDHNLLISDALEEQKEYKLEYDIATAEYGDEKVRICTIFPQFENIIEKLEDGTTFDIELWECE